MSGSTRLNRKGATLPLTILLLALMGVAVAITYSRISSERRITGDSRSQLGAFAVAQSGLNRFLSTLNGKPAGPFPVTVTYNDLPGGSARVDLTQLRESTTTLLPALYSITSRGTYTAGKRYDALSPSAQRTVGTYALWTPAPFDLNAGFTSISGITKNGGSGALSGIDRCGAAAAIPGVAVPNGGYIGDVTVINGNPDDAAVGMGTGGLGGTAKDEVDIDWAGIIAGTYLPAAYTYPTWPTAAQMNNWPITRVNGDLTLPGNGKGILIVTGNLTISGGDTWEGLVLVGGTITSNGNNTVYGGTVSGLNIKIGVAVLPSTIANGNKTYQYDSCSLSRALGKIGSIQRVRNGWTDSWSSY
ncbi:MAG TPA: hypothetical protein VNO19_05540 [Gemmatimonadales bacterium]|nr:hypothetical protein [Gemmatimonadales bacterium]